MRQRQLNEAGRVRAAYDLAKQAAKKKTTYRWWRLTSGPAGSRKLIPMFRLLPLELYALQAVWRAFVKYCDGYPVQEGYRLPPRQRSLDLP